MTGNRLGIVVETVTMFAFGLVLGGLFNWQLTLIGLAFNLIVFALACVDIRIQTTLAQRTAAIQSQATSVRNSVVVADHYPLLSPIDRHGDDPQYTHGQAIEH